MSGYSRGTQPPKILSKGVPASYASRTASSRTSAVSRRTKKIAVIGHFNHKMITIGHFGSNAVTIIHSDIAK
jgi:hypothetical protein